MIGLLVVGFVCNELIRPVNEEYHEPTTTDRAADPSPTAGAQS